MLIDTSAIISYFGQSETSHKAVANTVGGILRRGGSLEVLDTVLEEALSVVRKRVSKQQSVKLAKFLTGKKIPEIISLDKLTVNESVKFFIKHKGKYSYVDCSLISWAKLHSRKTILAVDKHFSELGLKIIP